MLMNLSHLVWITKLANIYVKRIYTFNALRFWIEIHLNNSLLIHWRKSHMHSFFNIFYVSITLFITFSPPPPSFYHSILPIYKFTQGICIVIVYLACILNVIKKLYMHGCCLVDSGLSKLLMNLYINIYSSLSRHEYDACSTNNVTQLYVIILAFLFFFSLAIMHTFN